MKKIELKNKYLSTNVKNLTIISISSVYLNMNVTAIGHGFKYISRNSFNLVLPYYFTGFTDAEGCFHLSVVSNPKMTNKFSVKLLFSIWLKKEDKMLLVKFKEFIGVGEVYKVGAKGFAFHVKSINELKLIINHFNSYALLTHKWSDYELFKQAYILIKNKEDLTLEGLKKIVSIKASMNNGLTPVLKKAFPNVVAMLRPSVKNQAITDPNWIAGFVEGEGCFFVVVNKSPLSKLGLAVRLSFNISQHIRDEKLLRSLKIYLNCGIIHIDSNGLVRYVISKFSDIVEKLIPLLHKHPLLGNKWTDFKDFCLRSWWQNLWNLKLI